MTERGVSKGPVLCVKHARQVAREGRDPEGPCAPYGSWLGGDGRQVTCDVAVAPERIAAYFAAHQRAGNERS